MAPIAKNELTAVVINFNTAPLTCKCARSLFDAGLANIFILDNGSADDDYQTLVAGIRAISADARVIRSSDNVGFAEGSNRLIDAALADEPCRAVLLVNSDAVVDANGLGACLGAMADAQFDLMGGRLLKPAGSGSGEAVDSLGIALYKSLLASNRKSVSEAYLGPTGGFTILSRRFVEEVKRLHGYVFDPTYFCYAEDTDLCIRARLLGASVGYVDRVVAYHEGQGSSTGTYNDFILYHGIRNSIWTTAKSIPGAVLLLHLPWFVLLHAGIILRHVRQGRWKTLLRLYRDALRAFPRVIAQRRRIQRSRRVTIREFRAHIDPRFYESRFLKAAVRELFPLR